MQELSFMFKLGTFKTIFWLVPAAAVVTWHALEILQGISLNLMQNAISVLMVASDFYF